MVCKGLMHGGGNVFGADAEEVEQLLRLTTDAQFNPFLILLVLCFLV